MMMNPYRVNKNQLTQQIEQNNGQNRGINPDESQLQVWSNIRSFVNENQLMAIMNSGYLDSIKRIHNTRLLILNLNGLRPSNKAKLTMFIESCT